MCISGKNRDLHFIARHVPRYKLGYASNLYTIGGKKFHRIIDVNRIINVSYEIIYHFVLFPSV